jgi:hypothetical protein
MTCRHYPSSNTPLTICSLDRQLPACTLPRRYVYFYATHPTPDPRAQAILARKAEVTWLEAVGEEGMLHSILSSLPNIYEEGGEGDPSLPILGAEANTETKAEGVAAVAVDEKPETDALPNGDHVPESTLEVPPVVKPVEGGPSSIPPPPDPTEEVSGEPLLRESPSVKQEFSGDTDITRNITPSSDPSTNGPDKTVLNEPPANELPTFSENDATLVDKPIAKAEPEETKPAPTSTSTPPSEPELEDSDPWPDTPGQPAKARLSLSSLLRQADDLLVRFPPTQPSLDLDKILGPRSVIFTWKESFPSLPSDDELEQYVKTPYLVVLPYIDPMEEVLRKEKEAREPERRRVERRNKLRKSFFARTKVQKKTMFAGAALALGIAMAVYGIRAPGDAGRGHHRGDWKKLLRYIGGLLLMGSDRLVGRLLGH